VKKSDYAKLFTLRKDGRYQTNYKDVAGKWHTLSDRDPERLYEKLEDAKKPRPVTFRDAAEAWETEYRESCNPRTWNNYRPHYEDIVDRCGDKPVSEIAGIDVIQDLQRAKAQGYSRTIVNSRRTIFNNILNHAVAQGWIPWNVAQGIKLPKGLPSSRRTAPTDEQIRAVIAGRDLPFGMFAFLLLCTGLRKGEALALLKSDVEGGVIRVSKSLTLLDGSAPKVKAPKSEAGNREVPILSLLQEPLEEYKSRLDGDVLFPSRSYNGSPGGSYMSQSNYDTAWAAYCAAAGLGDLTAHQLRHGTATLLFEAGVDVYTAKKILGHAKVTTTMEIYTELREQKEKQSISKLDEYMAALSAKHE
jgi:integrase